MLNFTYEMVGRIKQMQCVLMW